MKRIQRNKLLYQLGSTTRLNKNLQRLIRWPQYREGWNGYSARRIDRGICRLCMHVVLNLPERLQPQVFPTGWGTVQFEYGSICHPEKAGPHFALEVRGVDCIEHYIGQKDDMVFPATKENILASLRRYLASVNRI